MLFLFLYLICNIWSHKYQVFFGLSLICSSWCVNVRKPLPDAFNQSLAINSLPIGLFLTHSRPPERQLRIWVQGGAKCSCLTLGEGKFNTIYSKCRVVSFTWNPSSKLQRELCWCGNMWSPVSKSTDLGQKQQQSGNVISTNAICNQHFLTLHISIKQVFRCV